MDSLEGMVLAWGYFQPVSLFERVAVVAISYGSGSVGLAIAEEALHSFLQMKLKSHQEIHSILSNNVMISTFLRNHPLRHLRDFFRKPLLIRVLGWWKS